ncbi:MAG: UDP-N-acetylmuramoyl-L-alanine--D-glutamate ligase [Polyangiales bacterium]
MARDRHPLKSLVGARAIVVGLGVSGEAAARLLARKGAHVVANDARSRQKIGESNAAALERDGVALALGGHDDVDLVAADLVVISPGVPALPFILDAEQRGAHVVSELELASWFVDADVVAVGGTNGKSTTTELCAVLAQTTGRPVFAGGNLGVPLSSAVAIGHAGVAKGGICVVEVSSFQVERVRGFRPRASILLNVTDDHLDRYSTFEAYAQAKGNAFAAQRADDFAIVPHGDALCLRLAQRGYARIETIDGPSPATLGLEGDRVVDRVSGVSMSLDQLKLQGRHNVTNVCAAWSAMRAIGCDSARFPDAIASFGGLAHRTVFVDEIAGVRCYDDSKGTNVGASVTALLGLREDKAVLIAGGKDKGGSYAPLIEALDTKGRGLVLIGEAAPLIEAAARAKSGSGLPIVRATDMRDAVEQASKIARGGDAILLSPACSSFDMFRDYKHRGDAFAEAVRALAITKRAST